VSATEHSFSTVAGVPVHYARQNAAAYGTRGQPHTFRCTHDMFDDLETCFADLWSRCPDGAPEVITCAGTYVNKPGYHGQGRAFDLDALFWTNRTMVTRNFASYPGYYLGVQAVLHKHFGTVLNYHYNADHRDHYHFDQGFSVGFSSGRETIANFLQGCAKYMFGVNLTIDGNYGNQTRSGCRTMLTSLGIAGASELDGAAAVDQVLSQRWLALLDALAAKGMSM
jgi:hypothetical protein